MRFHVAGLGSIGTLFAHHLRVALDPKHDVVLLHKTTARMRYASQLNPTISVFTSGVAQSSSGFLHEISDSRSQPHHSEITPRGNSARVVASQQSMSIDDTDHLDDTAGPIDSLFVASKAHAVIPVMHQLLHRIRPSSTIVFLHNGMGVYERLLHEIFRNHENRPHFIFTSNTHGAYTVGRQKVVHATHEGAGVLQFGVIPDPRGRNFEARKSTPIGDRILSLDAISSPGDPEAHHYSSLRSTVAVLSSLTGLNVRWEPYSEIVMAMKRKVVVNSVINPLTAIMNCRNGDLIDSPNMHRLGSIVCEEAALAFALEHNERSLEEGRHFALPQKASLKDHHKATLLSRIPVSLRADALMSEVIRVAKATALNTSSMVQDIRANRSTEIDYLNGYLYRLGRKYNLKMSTNALLLSMVKLRQDIPLDIVQDLPPQTMNARDTKASSAEKLVARAWALVRMRKFKRKKFRWRWQIRAMKKRQNERESDEVL